VKEVNTRNDVLLATAVRSQNHSDAPRLLSAKLYPPDLAGDQAGFDFRSIFDGALVEE
jgi:hypothetical protein